MALSTIHDVATHGPRPPGHNATHVEHVTAHHLAYADKHFRPNPDAKPFVPNPFAMPPTNWHFIPNENGKSVNGFLPQFWVQPPVNHEIAGPGASTKKHIAFHLVSNVLDDEVPEDGNKDQLMQQQQQHMGFHAPIMHKDHNMHNNNTVTNVIDTWHESESNNFNLPIKAEQKSDNKGSINNKSIHEIWSPDPSPNDMNNIAQQSEEVLTSYSAANQQNQLLESPTSAVDSTDVSFEQVQNEMINQQMYSEVDQENMDANAQYYQNMPPSPIYQHPPYNYRNMPPPPQHPGPHPPPEMYTVVSPRMNNNIRPVVLDPARGYYPHPPYMNRYPYEGHHSKQRPYNSRREHQRHHEPPLQVTYETKMSCIEELGICIDECRDQLKHLERDCKKADVTLSQEFRLRKASLGDGSSMKYPPNSTRIDKLIVDQQKEHQKEKGTPQDVDVKKQVESLIGRIERLGFTPLHPNVGVTLDSWLTSIKELRGVRKNELANINDNLPYNGGPGGGGPGGPKSHTQADVYNLVLSVKDLTKLTRSARTVVWCAIQMLYGSNSGGE